jgi:exopolyphosphatase/guanosine-5'-triphosphate,3'-diphosphate pyrophosphatase
LVVDVGGGSTELVYGDAAGASAAVRTARSVDVGSRRITEMFLPSDPPTAAEMEAARGFVADAIAPALDTIAPSPSKMVAVAGTATTLSAIKLEMPVYDAERIHGSTLGRDDIAGLLGRLSSLPRAEREEVVGLDPGRAPVIVAGAIILGAVLGHSGLDETVVSDHDILYGILLDTYAGGV